MSSQSSSRLTRQSIREFLLETQESLGQVEAELIKLDQDPETRNHPGTSAGRMFRLLHSIKGTCGFLGYPKVEELAHVGENLLGRIRDGMLEIDATVITAMLSIVDAIREVLDHIESERNEGTDDYSHLTQQLTQILGQDDLSVNAPVQHFVVSPEAPASDTASSGGMITAASMVGSLSEVGKNARGQTDSRQLVASNREPSDRNKKGPEARVSDSSLRVDVSLLDRMMMLAGELVQTRNQLLQETATPSSGQTQGHYRKLNSITSELQACIMKSRMQPIATVWNQIPRMVRDVALGAFKQVRLEMEGAETELDKAIIESISDPLKHVLRNCVDHGIELPELRTALGKPAEGRIWMRAYHAGGQVNIEIEDDGAGIDPQAVRRIALERRVISHSQIEQMNDVALFGLIFQPGFSTATRVTKLSGRGVGLDVVKTNIEKLGGAIHVQSRVGRGTTITLRIPLTLAIVDALIVLTAGEAYAIPQSRIVELLRLRGADAAEILNAPSGIPNFRFRGRLLPVVWLRKTLELDIELDTTSKSELNLVVLRVQDRQFGLVVDRIVDTQEVVIKPLWQPLREIATYAGATQLADGTIALILDPVGLAKRAGLIPEQHDSDSTILQIAVQPEAGMRMLMSQLPGGERIALTISGLKRIEKRVRSQGQSLHRKELITYKDEIIPVIDVARLWDNDDQPMEKRETFSPDRHRTDSTYIAIYEHDGTAVGLNVGRFADISQDVLDVRGKPTRRFVAFTAMLEDQLIEFLDLDSILAASAIHLENQLLITMQELKGD
jgi:two-component system chemotaxis sensor kinase CheA